MAIYCHAHKRLRIFKRRKGKRRRTAMRVSHEPLHFFHKLKVSVVPGRAGRRRWCRSSACAGDLRRCPPLDRRGGAAGLDVFPDDGRVFLDFECRWDETCQIGAQVSHLRLGLNDGRAGLGWRLGRSCARTALGSCAHHGWCTGS